MSAKEPTLSRQAKATSDPFGRLLFARARLEKLDLVGRPAPGQLRHQDHARLNPPDPTTVNANAKQATRPVAPR